MTLCKSDVGAKVFSKYAVKEDGVGEGKKSQPKIPGDFRDAPECDVKSFSLSAFYHDFFSQLESKQCGEDLFLCDKNEKNSSLFGGYNYYTVVILTKIARVSACTVICLT